MLIPICFSDLMRTDFINEKVQTGLVKQIQGKWIINVVIAKMTKTKRKFRKGISKVKELKLWINVRIQKDRKLLRLQVYYQRGSKLPETEGG